MTEMTGSKKDFAGATSAPLIRPSRASNRLWSARSRALSLLEMALTLCVFSAITIGVMMAVGEAAKTARGTHDRKAVITASSSRAPTVQPTLVQIVEPPAPAVTINSEPTPRAEAVNVVSTDIAAARERLMTNASKMSKLTMAIICLLGIMMMALGLVKLKRAAETEGETPYSDGAWRMAVGAGLVALPAVMADFQGSNLPTGTPPGDLRTQYASVPSKAPTVSNVNVGLHDLAEKLDAMQLAETCPGAEFASQSCSTVGEYLVRRDMDGTISVSMLTRTAGGRPVANEVLRVVGHEPYLSNEIADKDLEVVKKQLIRTFLAR